MTVFANFMTHRAMVRRAGWLAGAALGALAMTSGAYAQDEEDNTLLGGRLKVNFYALQAFQAIQAKEGAFRPEDEEQSSNFQRLRVNLELSFQISDHIRAYVDIAEEPNDFSNFNDVNFTFNQDFAGIDFELFGLSGAARDDATLILSLGNIGTAPFQFKGFQDGAATQSNPLIGNSPVDFATAESGAQLAFHQHSGDGLIESFNVIGAITGSTFGEVYNENRGFNYRVQGAVETAMGIDVGLNYLKANQGDQLDISGTQVGSLDGVTRPGYVFGDGENYNFSSSPTSARDTHVGVLPGLEMEILQLNVQVKPTPSTTLIGMYGVAKDDFAFVDGSGNITGNVGNVGVIAQESEINYYVLEGTQYVVPDTLYLAARYTNVTNETPGITSENTLERLQVGAGYWLTDRVLAKVEYVDQTEEANSGGQIGAGFDGFSAEVSVKF